jgi:hypothetical protein
MPVFLLLLQLTDAEWAFRIAKDELCIRPIWHQKEDRVRAHILVWFLAYVLLNTLAGWMQRSGLGDAPRTLLEEFTATWSSRRDRLRAGRYAPSSCDASPSPIRPRRSCFSRLGLTLPKRLRRLDEPGTRIAAVAH